MAGFEARQIVVVHEELWRALVAWGEWRNLMLVRIPASCDEDGHPVMDPGDDLPPYAFMPKL
jgi:hypothetical protein